MPNGYDYGVKEYPEYSDLSVTNVLRNSFTILRCAFTIFFILALISVIPEIVAEKFSKSEGQTIPALFILITVLAFLIPLLINAAITYVVYKVIMGDKPNINTSIRVALERLIPVVFITIIMGFVIFGAAATVGVALFFKGAITTTFAVVATVFALKLLISWSVAVPACVIEKLGAIDSLKRSTFFTTGYKVKIVIILLIAGVIMSLTSGVLSTISHLLPIQNVEVFISLLVALPAAFLHIVTVVLYFDLRGVQEVLTFDDIANVFD